MKVLLSFLTKPSIQRVNFLFQTNRCLPRLNQSIQRCYSEKKKSKKNKIMDNANQVVKRSDYIVWVDLEMSGLDIDKDHILEMACLITDKNLNIIAEGPEVVIKQPDEVLDGMGEWCQKTHTESGLVQSVKNSTISLKNAEDMMLEFIEKYCPPGKCPLAGNSIHVDRIFLNKYMQRFNTFLHYRIVDVSSVKELCCRWYPTENSEKPYKKGNHRALEDIKASIEELQYYRKAIFKQKPTELNII